MLRAYDLTHCPFPPPIRRWKNDEIAALRKGIEDYGRDWVKISKMIPSRTREQVKNKVSWLAVGDVWGGRSGGQLDGKYRD